MPKSDARKLGASERGRISREAVQRVLLGESPEVVIRELGFARATIYNWLARYHARGWDGLKSGKASGRPKVATSFSKQLRLWELLVESIQFNLWTTQAVKAALRKRHRVRLSTSSVRRLLKLVGFTFENPLDRSYHNNPEFVERWKTEEFSIIKAEAKQSKALIYFVGASELRLVSPSAQNNALSGQPMVIGRSGNGYNLIYASGMRRLQKFMVVEGIVSEEQVCEFLSRLSKETARPVFVVWNDHPLHRSEKVLGFIEQLAGKLRVFYLPTFSQEEDLSRR